MSVETSDKDSIAVERAGAGPIIERETDSIIEFQRGIEAVLERGEIVDLQVLRDYKDRIWGELRRDITGLLSWPSTWYIPSQADYHNYWFMDAPAANRYAFGWGESQLYPPPNALSGNPATGAVYAYTALNPSDAHDTAFAGVAARFRPSATLSYADISIDADIVTQSRIWMLLGRHTSNLPTAHIRCTAYVVVWEIDPVSGVWQQVAPYGSKTLTNRSDSGLSGSAIQTVVTHVSGSNLSTRVQVQSGRTYAVGFQAQVDIDCNVRDDQNQPYQRSDVDDWKLWADMTCSVPQITISTTVLIH